MNDGGERRDAPAGEGGVAVGPEWAGARKALRLLEALQRTPAGAVIYRQVERLLEDADVERLRVERTYAALLHLLLEAFLRHLEPGSPMHVQVRLVQRRLQPPLSVAELDHLRQYVEQYARELAGRREALDLEAFREALAPLLEDYGVRGGQAARAPEAAGPAGGAAEAPPAGGGAESAGATPAAAAAPAAVPDSARQAEEVRKLRKLQETLALQVQETILENQEFGVLLEVVLSELRQSGGPEDFERLRASAVREIEKMLRAHHALARKLDDTYRYLQMVETDSRRLGHELHRARVLSLTDELTHLPNRRAFLRRLEDEVGRVQRYGSSLSLAMIDLDGFKAINDRYGHAAGDAVLRCYANDILSVFRHHDLVARYGGEEFAVLLPNTDREGALRALAKVKKRAAETYCRFNGRTLKVPSFSAGVALYRPGETPGGFIERADAALYRAKRLGRNRIEFDESYTGEEEEEQDASSRGPERSGGNGG
ncbi:MAG TPA: GGDEF domain-containing protein [Chromatiales bacterium]|nr:GGDEF domain-containing protein [Chromatiales bacterium]